MALPTTTPINALGLKPRYLNALLATGLFPTLGHLAPTSMFVLLRVDGIGTAGVKDIRARVAAAGYVLGQPLPPEAPRFDRRRNQRRRLHPMRYL